MNTASVQESYKLLNVDPAASDEQIMKSYRSLALRYHPDKNPDKTEWANGVMSRINTAYTIIMSSRFKKDSERPQEAKPAREEPSQDMRAFQEAMRKKREAEERMRAEELRTEAVIDLFADIREKAKEPLYRFFQYSLYNIARREQAANRGIFDDIVRNLKKTYHDVTALIDQTGDDEVIEHLNIYGAMIFNFYRASECLNVPDRYDSRLDIEAFRLYRRGEESLHKAHREVFFARHNRGRFDKNEALAWAKEGREFFKHTLTFFPDSTWVVEAGIKLDYTESLISYITLFFSEE
jgi:curved DNA-binding protein CbpA